jgi:hypothetical protein
MQMKKYSEAVVETTKIIGNTNFELSPIGQVFKRSSKEVIWQIELPTNTYIYNSYEATMFKFIDQAIGTTISQSLLSLFGGKDIRKSIWIGTSTDQSTSPATEYHFPNKYTSTTDPADEYTTPFRLAEMYLIRAEARAQLGLSQEAIDDTDSIRIRAGLNPLNISMTDAALLDSIATEKRREMFCEWGIRWFDIRRSDNIDELMTIIAAQKATTWKPAAVLWPVPLNDILNSANNLVQNEGYN